MAIIVYNTAGLIMVLVALGAAAVFGIATELDDWTPMALAGGPVMMALDVLYRTRIRDGHWFSPSRGGSFCFVPVWIIGATIVVCALATRH